MTPRGMGQPVTGLARLLPPPNPDYEQNRKLDFDRKRSENRQEAKMHEHLVLPSRVAGQARPVRHRSSRPGIPNIPVST
jgi:hypothetical protein